MNLKKKTVQGFTLVELLVVIAIIAILASVVMLVVNPLELTRRTRDANRLTDLANLMQAINVSAQEAVTGGTEVLCVGGVGADLTCSGNSNDAGANTRLTDGTGWIKVDLASQTSVSVPTLPVDPTNDATNYYSYKSDGTTWEINAILESATYIPKMLNVQDGGTNDAAYEVGSSLTLIP